MGWIDMARRKRGRRVNGWLILDKPLHMTSTQAVGVVKRLFDAQKAGHAGTLDPLATGILPIALGEATKTVPFAVDGLKAYDFIVRWGMETSTDDTEGEAVETSSHRPDRASIEACLPEFRGAVRQVPPQFSAIKVAGQRAYDLARDGEEVVLEARDVFIEDLHITGMPDDDSTSFSAVCGKGTYVRSLARDIGRKLGCFGHVTSLRRTRVGPFECSHAVTIEELHERAENGTIDETLLPIEAALSELHQITVTGNDASRLARGQTVLVRGRDAPILGGVGFAMHKGRLLALVEMEKGEIRPTRVFNMGQHSVE
jgi:tRNA pseudouridine55 synthase